MGRISNSFGVEAEKQAANYLKKKGYKILARNFRIRGGEIDIIALSGRVVIFVEVKARTSLLFGSPFESITYNKLRHLQKTASYFLTVKNLHGRPFRFDAIEVTYKNNLFNITHLENITM